MSAVLVRAGDLIGGKYRLERQIGTGGMGVVFAAMHIHLEQQVALKFLLKEAANNPEVVERFRREARAAVKIQSEHVARVIDIGELDDGLPYIVMEYLEGDDLENVVRTTGPLSTHDAVRYVLHACEALAEVHVQGIVHRDIKPANLFLAARADGTHIVKLLDFGISKAAPVWTEEGVRSLTQTTSVIGSPRYMSPEQLRSSRDVDARSDVWALGVTLFELLGGTSPFASGTMPEVCASILKDEPLSLAGVRPDIDPNLEDVIRRCLAKEVDDRWSNVAELAEALRPFGPPGTTDISVDRIRGVLQQAGATTSVSHGSGPIERDPANRSRASALRTPVPTTQSRASSTALPPGVTRPPKTTTPMPMRTFPPATATSNAGGLHRPTTPMPSTRPPEPQPLTGTGARPTTPLPAVESSAELPAFALELEPDDAIPPPHPPHPPISDRPPTRPESHTPIPARTPTRPVESRTPTQQRPMTRPPQTRTPTTPPLAAGSRPTTRPDLIVEAGVAAAQLTDDERVRRYLEQMGDRTRVPHLAIDPSQIMSLQLDHRAGFLISTIDGVSTLDEILDISAMPRVETLELLLGLIDRGVLTLR